MSCVPARALFHTAPRCVEIRELPTPQPAPGEVLVRTVCSGISGGTERLVYRGEVPAESALDDTIDALGGAFTYPFSYGYACVGEVAESGQAVFAFHPHQDVFVARAGTLPILPPVRQRTGLLQDPSWGRRDAEPLVSSRHWYAQLQALFICFWVECLIRNVA